jgi:SAM-dependent methyltransferase
VAEVCGDSPLTVSQRFAYLVANVLRNLRERGPRPIIEPFFAARLATTPAMASPSRMLTEAYLELRLPKLLPVGRLRVLEIGCGSGRLCSLLARVGYYGDYVGIDISDRFDPTPVDGFTRRFVHTDVHAFDPGAQRFDLILSVSALEHIPEDGTLIARLPGWLAPGGLDLHFVPGGWGLAAYLWHGWRQYPLAAIRRKFGGAVVASPLGGMAGAMLHVAFITLGEMLLRLTVRRRWPAAYGWMLDRCLKLDRWLPWCAIIHAVRRQSPMASSRG